jgi:hypothetical protein
MATFEDVQRLTSHLPEVTVSTSFATPALKVRGKSFCRLWGDRDFHKADVSGTEVLVVFCELEEKQGLLDDGGGAVFTAPHYDGHGSVLVKLADIGEADLSALLLESYLLKAPKSIRSALGDPA